MGGDALETADGAALATEIVDMLESELVRFRHRLTHGHGMEIDRARAAMVLLGKLVSSGVAWTAKPDSDPTKIYEAFSSLIPDHPEIRASLKKEVAAFFIATSEVKTVEDTSVTPAAILRRAGAEPSLWWWAADHGDLKSCWAACVGDVGNSVQVALAFGVPVLATSTTRPSPIGVSAASTGSSALSSSTAPASTAPASTAPASTAPVSTAVAASASGASTESAASTASLASPASPASPASSRAAPSGRGSAPTVAAVSGGRGSAPTMAAAVVPALAKAFALLATRLKTRHASPRTMLVAALTSLASGSIDDAAAITKLAFEMRFKEPEAKDPLAELSIHAFQLVEAMQATKDQPDVERFGALARRVDRMFESRGLNLSALVRGELQPAIDEAIGRARSAAP